jgi:predicted 3-demethylubiquinone-9 3-methyltransferase (glyoxalase superfamily)
MEMMKSPDRAASKRASEAMITMVKLDIAALEKAFKAG